MRVKSCVASDGGGHTIQLSDELGCVLRPKMISRFLKARGSDDRATVITYAFFHAFKFPDALSVHIKCKVEICRHGCLDHCQLSDNAGHFIQDRKDQQQEQQEHQEHEVRPLYPPTTLPPTTEEDDTSLYDDIIRNGDEMASIGGHFLGVEKSAPKAQAQMSNRLSSNSADNQQHEDSRPEDSELSHPFLVSFQIDDPSFLVSSAFFIPNADPLVSF